MEAVPPVGDGHRIGIFDLCFVQQRVVRSGCRSRVLFGLDSLDLARDLAQFKDGFGEVIPGADALIAVVIDLNVGCRV